MCGAACRSEEPGPEPRHSQARAQPGGGATRTVRGEVAEPAAGVHRRAACHGRPLLPLRRWRRRLLLLLLLLLLLVHARLRVLLLLLRAEREAVQLRRARLGHRLRGHGAGGHRRDAGAQAPGQLVDVAVRVRLLPPAAQAGRQAALGGGRGGRRRGQVLGSQPGAGQARPVHLRALGCSCRPCAAACGCCPGARWAGPSPAARLRSAVAPPPVLHLGGGDGRRGAHAGVRLTAAVAPLPVSPLQAGGSRRGGAVRAGAAV
jgi:hypothetical protein